MVITIAFRNEIEFDQVAYQKVIFTDENRSLSLLDEDLFTLLKRLTQLGDNCIQNFHLGRYIVGYTVRNLVLRRRASGAVKRGFRTYIRRYTSPNENFEYGYPHSNALLQFRLKFVINDVKLFPAVYRRIY